MAFFGHRRAVFDGPPTTADCPSCGASGATATPRLFDETLLLAGLIPVYRQRTLFVRCEACRRSSTSTAKGLDAFVDMDAGERSASLRAYASGVGRFLVVAALALFWFPFLAPLLALAGLLMTWRHPRWRRLGTIALGASLLVAVALTALLITHP
jgi:hypothetical protein